MTTKQADKIIEAGNIVVVRSNKYNEQFFALFVRRDRYWIYDCDGNIYDLGEWDLVRGAG